MRIPITLLLLLLSPGATAVAEGSDRFQRMLDPSYRLLDGDGQDEDEEEEEEEEEDDPTWLRLEVGYRVATPMFIKIKKGEEPFAQSFKTDRDAHLPNYATQGLNLYLDVKLASWASVGAVYRWSWVQGPHRHLHYEGITLNGRSFPGGAFMRTRVDVQYGEVTLRYWWSNTKSTKLWFGMGAAWTSFRVALRGAGLRGTGRIEDVFGPVVTYYASKRVTDWLGLYLDSALSVNPGHRFPSYVSHFRLGMRFYLGGGLVFTVSFQSTSALLGDVREQVTKKVRDGHRWRRVRFGTFGAVFGLAYEI